MSLSKYELIWLQRMEACARGIDEAMQYGSLADAWNRTGSLEYKGWATNKLRRYLPKYKAGVFTRFKRYFYGEPCGCGFCLVNRGEATNPFYTPGYQAELLAIIEEFRGEPEPSPKQRSTKRRKGGKK